MLGYFHTDVAAPQTCPWNAGERADLVELVLRCTKKWCDDQETNEHTNVEDTIPRETMDRVLAVMNCAGPTAHWTGVGLLTRLIAIMKKKLELFPEEYHVASGWRERIRRGVTALVAVVLQEHVPPEQRENVWHPQFVATLSSCALSDEHVLAELRISELLLTRGKTHIEHVITNEPDYDHRDGHIGCGRAHSAYVQIESTVRFFATLHGASILVRLLGFATTAGQKAMRADSYNHALIEGCCEVTSATCQVLADDYRHHKLLPLNPDGVQLAVSVVDAVLEAGHILSNFLPQCAHVALVGALGTALETLGSQRVEVDRPEGSHNVFGEPRVLATARRAAMALLNMLTITSVTYFPRTEWACWAFKSAILGPLRGVPFQGVAGMFNEVICALVECDQARAEDWQVTQVIAPLNEAIQCYALSVGVVDVILELLRQWSRSWLVQTAGCRALAEILRRDPTFLTRVSVDRTHVESALVNAREVGWGDDVDQAEELLRGQDFAALPDLHA